MIDKPGRDLKWFYISFADDGFLGGVYIQGMDMKDAFITATQRGLNPGGEAMITGPIADELLERKIPVHDRERLLSKEEVL